MMDKFELKVDVNTPYIKAIRFIGTLVLGFFIGVTLIKYQYEGSINWMNSLIGILCSLAFAFFPGAASKRSIRFDDGGISLQNYRFHWGQKKEVTWDRISAVRVNNNAIEIKMSIGSTEKIKLPIHTKEQLQNLKNYLRKLTDNKQVDYISS